MPETKKEVSKGRSDEYKEKMRKKMKQLWKSDDYRKKTVKGMKAAKKTKTA